MACDVSPVAMFYAPAYAIMVFFPSYTVFEGVVQAVLLLLGQN